MGRLFHMKYTAECHRFSVQSQDAKYIGFYFQEQQYEANVVFNYSEFRCMEYDVSTYKESMKVLCIIFTNQNTHQRVSAIFNNQLWPSELVPVPPTPSSYSHFFPQNISATLQMQPGSI